MNANIVIILIVVILGIGLLSVVAPKLRQAGYIVGPPGSDALTTATTTPGATSSQTKPPLIRVRPVVPPPVSPMPEPTPVPEAPLGFTTAQLSPYYQKVRIAGVQPPPSFFDDTSQFAIVADGANASAIVVTGWRLRGNSGEVTVPKGLADYTPTGSNVEGNIALEPGSSLDVRSQRKNEFGRNFRLNRCTGFLNNVYVFNPGIPNDCPMLYRSEEIQTLSGKCQSLIYSLGSCEIPTGERWEVYGAESDADCHAFVNRFSYGECYRRFRWGPDFFSREWRAWLGARIPFDSQHDRILLLDQRGLLVDSYTY